MRVSGERFQCTNFHFFFFFRNLVSFQPTYVTEEKLLSFLMHHISCINFHASFLMIHFSCIIYYFFLQKISKEIKKLAERELSLEDMEEDDSIFMQEERYKARFVKVWEKLCEVKGREPQTGRLIEQKFRFQGTLLFC